MTIIQNETEDVSISKNTGMQTAKCQHTQG